MGRQPARVVPRGARGRAKQAVADAGSVISLRTCVYELN